jgi:hypothetical protein
MKIIPDSGRLPARIGCASSGTRPARHDQAAHPDCLANPVAGVVAVGPPADAGGARRYVVIGLLAARLGLQNATVRCLAVPDVATAVLTLSLTGLAADSWLAGGHSPRVGRRLAAVGLMAAGALAGALLLRLAVALRSGRQERLYSLYGPWVSP